ncbi:MAG: 50S ribosomal protein L17 [Leptonema sp. (in: bacteria)]
MYKGKKTKKLNRVTSHRKAMLKNMAVSLLNHEQIITTRAKAKALKPFVEKIISRAIRNLNEGLSKEQKIHNKRIVFKYIKNKAILYKLFEDIAKRNQNRKGGYLRIIHLPERKKDSAEMCIIELVEKAKIKKIPRRELLKQKESIEKDKLDTLSYKKKEEEPKVTQQKKKQEKWYHKINIFKKNPKEKENSDKDKE